MIAAGTPKSFGTEAAAVLRRDPLQRYGNDAETAWSAVFTDRIWACGQVAPADDLARFTPSTPTSSPTSRPSRFGAAPRRTGPT
ncbi:MAG TPA: hypothetical protein VGG16_30120 [Streptosporangiaceae bacterium]